MKDKNKLEQTNKWWEKLDLTNELDKRYAALKTGEDKGLTVAKLEASFDVLRERNTADDN